MKVRKLTTAESERVRTLMVKELRAAARAVAAMPPRKFARTIEALRLISGRDFKALRFPDGSFIARRKR